MSARTSARLVITMPRSDDAPLAWHICEPDGLVHQGTLISSDDLPADFDPTGMPVDVIVPGEQVSLRALELPSTAGAKARLAAAFALEDMVAQSVENLHIALADKPAPGTPIPVAVVDRAVMDNWTARLKPLGLMIDRLVPDHALLPAEADVLVVQASDDGAVVHARLGHRWGATAEASLMAVVLPDLLSHHPDASVRVLGHMPQEVEEGLRTTGREVVLDREVPVVLARALQPLDAQTPNLLQGAYGPRTGLLAILSPWRRVAALAALVVVGLMLGQWLTVNRVNAQAEELEATAETIFREALPDVRRIVDIRSQMRQAVGSGAGAGDPFLQLQTLLFAAIEDNAGVSLQTLRFDADRGALQAEVSVGSFEDIQLLKNALADKPVAVQEGASRQAGGRIQSDLTLELRR